MAYKSFENRASIAFPELGSFDKDSYSKSFFEFMKSASTFEQLMILQHRFNFCKLTDRGVDSASQSDARDSVAQPKTSAAKDFPANQIKFRPLSIFIPKPLQCKRHVFFT